MRLYTIMGAFPRLRSMMDQEFKRVGFKGIKEKRWFLQKVLGSAPYLSEMTIKQMETVINELGQYNSIEEIK